MDKLVLSFCKFAQPGKRYKPLIGILPSYHKPLAESLERLHPSACRITASELEIVLANRQGGLFNSFRYL
jgi:hypothetical protein